MTCRCGNVQIDFATTMPRVSTECCCNHCFARVKYLEQLGGSSVPTKVPLLNSKWDNRITVVKGRDILFAYKLTPMSEVLNIASTCCHTFLLGRHPGYDANCVTTCSDFPIWTNRDGPFIASSRWFSNQWQPELLNKIPKLVGIWVNQEDGSIQGEPGWEEVFQIQVECMQREIRHDATGESFDDVLDAIGRDKIIVVNNSLT